MAVNLLRGFVLAVRMRARPAHAPTADHHSANRQQYPRDSGEQSPLVEGDEEEPEGAVGLGAEGDLVRAEQVRLKSARIRKGEGDAITQRRAAGRGNKTGDPVRSLQAYAAAASATST